MKKLTLGLIGAGLLTAGGVIYAMQQGHGSYAEMHAAHHGSNHGDHGRAGADHVHDEVNMPGLQGRDTTEQEVADLKTIFTQHQGIRRSVSPLFNGILTTTESDDPALRDAIIGHVAMMVARLEAGRNPEVMIQSPTLDALFEVYDQIDTTTVATPTGVKVTQTSANPEVVALLQKHASEVSDMSARGMQAVHERMMKNGH